MTKPPFNEDLNARISAHLKGRASPTIAGTQSSILSMGIAAKHNPLVIRKAKKPPPRSLPPRVEPQAPTAEQDRDMHARALRRFMNPRPGREHQDRLEALMLHTLGRIGPNASKAESMMTLVLLSELCAAVERRPSLFRTPKTEDGQVKVQISDRLWLGYMFIVVAANMAFRKDGNRKAANLQTVRDVEKMLPHGKHLNDVLPEGDAKENQRKPGAPEISQRNRRLDNLARRIDKRRRVFEAGDAPLIAQVAYGWFDSGNSSYASMVDAAAGALLLSSDPESMRAKAMLPTAE